MTMPAKVPRSAEGGDPVSGPVLAVKVAHEGMAWRENVTTLPAGSAASGLTESLLPATHVVRGIPEIVGVSFAGASTWIEKAGSEAVRVPSLAVMTMLEKTPTSAVGGDPES